MAGFLRACILLLAPFNVVSLSFQHVKGTGEEAQVEHVEDGIRLLEVHGPKHAVAKKASKHEKGKKLRHNGKNAGLDASPEALAKVAQPTGRPDKNESAAEATGVATNAAGDLDAFIAALITNIVMIIIFFIVASVLRKRYPLVYSKNTLTLKDHEDVKEEYEKEQDLDPEVKAVLEATRQEKMGLCAYTESEEGNNILKKEMTDDEITEMNQAFFGWWKASAEIHIDQVVEARGLDIAMMIEFTHVAMKITSGIGIPMVLIVGPCHIFLGGYRAGAPGTADADYLSYFGMANVVDGHPWLYFAHSIILWLVLIFVNRMLFGAMREFLGRRKAWLKKMPTPRGTTVLVEGIPEDKLSEAKLTKFIDDIFGKDGAVESTYMVKNTSTVLPLVQARDARKLELEGVEFKLTQGKDETLEAKKTELKAKLVEEDAEIKKAQTEIETEAKQVGGVNLTRAFVTFASRRDAELAKMITYTPDSSEFEVSIPPDPSDVIWKDLTVDPLHEKLWTVVGYGCIAFLYWAYLPTVVSIAYFTSLETLAEYGEPFASMAEDPSTSALWDGLVNALALQLFLGFVPTFLALIFTNFFVLKSGNSLQNKIQGWYFYFQVIFVLLVTAIGSSLLDTLEALAADPGSVFALLADTLPLATHFYLNYLPLQWVTHAQNMMRTSNLGKFKAFKALFGQAVALKKSEPEDQDYYGLGSRSARFTFMLTLTLTFCSLSPLIVPLGFVNFWMCRKCYGYLCVFCEIKKPDIGGYFYVDQLKHVSEGLFIYVILMTGVLAERDLTAWPGMIAASALIFQYMSYGKLKTSFRWESLCFEDLMTMDEGKGKNELRKSTGVYKQPELIAK